MKRNLPVSSIVVSAAAVAANADGEGVSSTSTSTTAALLTTVTAASSGDSVAISGSAATFVHNVFARSVRIAVHPALMITLPKHHTDFRAAAAAAPPLLGRAL